MVKRPPFLTLTTETEMKEETKQKLAIAQKYCDNEEKSTEFMLAYMQDLAQVDLDCVLIYLAKYGGFEEVSQNKAKKIKQSGNVH